MYSGLMTPPPLRAATGDAISVHPAFDVAALYIRQSRRKADGSEASPAVQLDETSKKAANLGLTALAPYSDVGISGYDPKAERPGFERMLKDAAAGKFSKIVVYYMSRFSRQSPLEVLAVVRELWAYGITIISVTEGEFIPDDFGSLIHLLARLEGNHKESHLKSINVTATKKKARERGGYMGGQAPYGFRTEKVLRDGVAIVTLHPDETEAPIVRDLIRHLLANRDAPADKHGKHPASILSAVEWLNAHPEAEPRRGEQWGDSSVTRLLVDPRVAGMAAEYVYERAADEERRRKSRAYVIVRDEDGRAVAGNEPIVSPDEWYALQEHITSRKGAGRAPSGAGLFSGTGLVECECGKAFTFFWARKTDVKNYRCPRTRTDDVGRTHDGGNTIAAHHLEDYAARCVLALITTASSDDDDVLEILVEATRRYGRRVEAPETAGERTELVRARAAGTQALEALYDREEAGDYDDPVGRKRFRQRKESIMGRITAASTRLAELDAATTPKLPLAEWAGDPEDDPIGPGSWWHQADMDDRREFLGLFIDRIVVSKAAHRGGNFNGVTFDTAARAEIKWATPTAEDDDE